MLLTCGTLRRRIAGMKLRTGILPLVAVAGLLLAACGGPDPRPEPDQSARASSPAASAPTAQFPSSYALDDVIIRMERTGCFGTCPIYSLQLKGDGAVVYNGIANVYIRGELHTFVSRQQVADLLYEFNRIGFFRLPDTIEAGQTLHLDGKRVDVMKLQREDLPNTRITLRVGDASKSVVYSQTAPEALVRMAERIDNMVNTARWVQRP